ncbi:MAG: sulfite exporter TauE/SafE family protein [Chloroflexi bacterium]|nr:sulfite exporter TauE/SafE family protein [Chloroflexota bacterium]
MPEDFVLLLILGLVAGLLSGMFGIGGGIVIVPALITFLAFSPVHAISTSLVALLLPVGIFAVMAYHRAGHFNWRASGLLALGIASTVWIGARLALSLPSDTLKQIYGVFLIVMGWRFLQPRKLWQEYRVSSFTTPASLPATPSDSAPATPFTQWYIILILGLVAGVASGLFGVGGGIIIVPILVGLLQYEQKRATAISLGALLLPVGLPAVITYYEAGELDIPTAIPVALGLVIGALGGAKIALGLPSARIRQLYGIFILLIGIRFVLGY